MRISPRSSARAGVSLLVVLLLLALIAAVAGFAVPAFFARAEVTLDNAARLLVRDIHSAQNRAMWAKIDALVVFDRDGGGYRVVDSSGRVLERLGALGDFAQRYAEGGAFEGVRVTRVQCGDDQALSFDAQQAHWEGGEVELTFQGESRIVRVQPRTGEVTVVGQKRPWALDQP